MSGKTVHDYLSAILAEDATQEEKLEAFKAAVNARFTSWRSPNWQLCYLDKYARALLRKSQFANSAKVSTFLKEELDKLDKLSSMFDASRNLTRTEYFNAIGNKTNLAHFQYAADETIKPIADKVRKLALEKQRSLSDNKDDFASDEMLDSANHVIWNKMFTIGTLMVLIEIPEFFDSLKAIFEVEEYFS